MIANDLWRKAGGDPQPLPGSDRDDAGAPWDDLAHNAAGRTACHWTKAPDWPDFDPASEHCEWVSGVWSVIEAPGPSAPVVRISHYEFAQLLTVEEKVRINAAKAQIRAMNNANYGDIAYAGLIALELVFTTFDLAAAVELTAPETAYAVSVVMRGAGVFASDDRAQQVLANIRPA